jgi:5-methylcytosine-specific restriction endonuclease McrA
MVKEALQVTKDMLPAKKKIPKALKEQVWLKYNGNKFNGVCAVRWCTNIITPFTFETGHNIPESKGGATDIGNLRPICSKCNKSMGDSYTIDEFSQLSRGKPTFMSCFCYPSS